MSFSVMKNFLKSQNLCGGKGELFNLEAHTHTKKKMGQPPTIMQKFIFITYHDLGFLD